MDVETMWLRIGSERRSLADLLEPLTEQQWAHSSLCTGWSVRDVAAHIAMVPNAPGVLPMIAGAVRARGNFNRLNRDLAVRYAADPETDIVQILRSTADSRRLPAVTSVVNLSFDILVHGQDIAIPLGLDRPMPTDSATAGAERVWTMGWPFWARRRLRGYRLVATDADWTRGAGSEIRGPVGMLLLLLTGRMIALSRLTGPGTDMLRGQTGFASTG
ncbi:maleylpyruvate isomerase family mycothiol-dependent enzyme [Nakamurella sp. GG22]